MTRIRARSLPGARLPAANCLCRAPIRRPTGRPDPGPQVLPLPAPLHYPGDGRGPPFCAALIGLLYGPGPAARLAALASLLAALLPPRRAAPPPPAAAAKRE